MIGRIVCVSVFIQSNQCIDVRVYLFFLWLGNKMSFLLAFPDCFTKHENVQRTRAYHLFGTFSMWWCMWTNRTHHFEQQLYQHYCLQYGPNENIHKYVSMCMEKINTHENVVTLHRIHTLVSFDNWMDIVFIVKICRNRKWERKNERERQRNRQWHVIVKRRKNLHYQYEKWQQKEETTTVA